MKETYHNWETDQRNFSECLNQWMRANLYENSSQAAEVLRVNWTTLHGWRFGRPCSLEKTLRLLMTCLDRLTPD